MKTSLTICFCFFVMLACQKPAMEATDTTIIPTPWADTSSLHPKHAAFSALLTKYNKLGLPGMSLLVNDRNGTWLGAAGKADIEKGVPFGVGQVGKVASITKLFMGALVFKLIEDSTRTNLDNRSLYEPITKWLPTSVTSKLANGTNITLGDCMKHETGLPDLIEEDAFYLAVLNDPNKKWGSEELLQFIYDKPAVFNPRDTAIYSNTNTVLVAMVMEAATGQSHAKLLHQYILDPLNLQHTYYQPHDALPAHVAQGYFDLYNNNKIVNVSNIIPGSGNGYGGVFSNVFDLFTFSNALMVNKTLLTPKSFALMQTYGKPDDENQYGFGIMKKFIERGVNAGIGHSGRDLGYSANLFYFPAKGVTHAFLINYGTDSKSNLRDVFYNFQEELLNLTLQ